MGTSFSGKPLVNKRLPGGDAPGAGNYMAAVGESQLAATGENNWPSLGRTN
jgi:hypothetical protein